MKAVITLRPTDAYSATQIRWLFSQKELGCARYRRGVARSLALTDNDVRVLVCVARHGEISNALLSVRVGLSAQAVGAIVARLHELGLLERGSHRRDRRSTVLRLTNEAEATLQVAFAPLAERIDAVYADLPEEERRTVGRFLARVADASAEAAVELEATSAPAGARAERTLRAAG